MENDSHPAVAGIVNAGVALPGVERYGRYCLIERIGRGGMAEVFRAVAEGVEGFRRVFVIKRLRPEKSASVELTRMFCDEARLSALLHHPNIVQVYDFGQIHGTYFLAMEYLRGKDLAVVMKAIRAVKSAVAAPIAAHIAHQVATGLHYAHTLARVDAKPLGIVHRDVTPSNIMLQRTGAVKVLDFGIAQATNLARQVETGGGRVKGKLAYLSPEQVRLEELDARSDVFALGVVLWEMLTGQRLFVAENDFLTMRGVLTQPIPAPSSKRPSVPAALDAIVARALERERARRYASAQDLAEDLERFLQEAPCHSQALGRLLQDLFGDESAEQTPDFPAMGAASMSADPPNTPPVEPAAAPVLEMDADIPPPSAAADLAALRVAAPSAPLPVLPDQRRILRRAIMLGAAATLIACFSWATWRGRHPSPLAQATPPAAWPAPPTTGAVLSPPPPPSPEAIAVAAPKPDTEPAVAPSSPVRARPAAKKHVPRRLSSDVTIDPFK